MASDLAAPPTQLAPTDNMDVATATQDTFEAPVVNGDEHHMDESAVATDKPIDSAVDAPAVPSVEPTPVAVEAKLTAPAQADPNPAGPSPIEDVSSGIQPVADFIPKNSSHTSHPTPPPDEPLTTGAADVDIEMSNAQPEAEQSPLPSVAAQPEQSLVRPREDDADDQEPAAKRSRMEDADAPASLEVAPGMAGVPVDAPSAEPTEAVTTSILETVDEPAAAKVEEPTLESQAPAPESAVVPPEPTPTPAALPDQPLVDAPVDEAKLAEQAPHPQTQIPSSDAPEAVVETSTGAAAEAPVDTKPAEPVASGEAQPAAATPGAASEQPTYSEAPITSIQKNFLVEKMKNLKKTKHSSAFLRPVDPVALGIPTYPDIIKEPMDLSTMDQKLKANQYGSVKDFVDDFERIINNSRRFNGDNHLITQAGFNMQAYFNRMMQLCPSADAAPPVKAEKRRSPSVPREKPRREARAPLPPPTAAAPSGQPTETYALQSDGTPQIRRQSSNRPARAIKPPQNREIPYAKPKRKAHMLELRFCEHILDEMRSSKLQHLNNPFLAPVDPVVLQIPQYLQIIKKPMDLGTMATKLKNGEYGTAAEFKADFDQVIQNCMTFNPPGNPVRDMAIQLQREFQARWVEKRNWERKNQPASNRASSASADDESVDDVDDEDDADDDKAATIKALQKQLAEMQNAIAGTAAPGASKKKSRPSKSSSSKKVGGMSSVPKTKAPAKPAPKKKKREVTYIEKQEISDSVGNMNDEQIAGLTEIITDNDPRYRNKEEMELEIDDLTPAVQVMLLEYVRKIFGNPNKKKARDPSPEDAAALDDDDFEPDRRGSGAGGKRRKKHKPMGKVEQQTAIDDIRRQLDAFKTPASGSMSQSPANSSFNAAGAQPDSSGDEESEESEED